MSPMNDIPELYKRFDGNAGDYQELRRGDLAADAQQRWPLVAAVAAAPVVMPPSVCRNDVPKHQTLQNGGLAAEHKASMHSMAKHAVAAPCARLSSAGATPTLRCPAQPSRRVPLRARLAAAWRTFRNEGRS